MKALVALLVFLPAAAWGQTPKPFGTSCAYPAAALANHRQGTTLLSFRGTDDGHIENVAVVHSSGHPDLDDAAVRCVYGWRFNPDVDETNIGTHKWNIDWRIAANGTAEGKSIGVPHDCLQYYPEREKAAGIGGTTIVTFTITEEGRVRSPDVVHSSGNGALDDAAQRCVKHWQYRPAMKGGKPVAVPWRADIVWKTEAPAIPAFAVPPRDCLKSYPVTAAELAGIGGVTELQFVIVQGGVTDISVVTSSGNKALDEAAKSCVASRRYVREKVMVDGQEVDRFRTITLRERFVWADALKHAK